METPNVKISDFTGDEKLFAKIIENPEYIKKINEKKVDDKFILKVLDVSPEAFDIFFSNRNNKLFMDNEFIDKVIEKKPELIMKKFEQTPSYYIDSEDNEYFLLRLVKMNPDNQAIVGRFSSTLKNNPEFMMEVIKTKLSNYEFIGKELRNNKEFMVELVDVLIPTYDIYDIKNVLGDVLKYDIEFVKSLIEKFSVKKSDENIIDNFYETEEEKNIIKYNWNREVDSEDIAVRMERRKEYLKYISTPESLTPHVKDNFVVMIDLIVICPDMYSYATDRLKRNKDFREKVIEAGVSQVILEAEEDRLSQKAEKVKERRREFIKNLGSLKAENAKQEYSESGSKNFDMKLVENFLASKVSKEQFCKENDITQRDFEKILKEISAVFPDLGYEIKWHNEKASEMFLSKIEKVVEKFLDFEISVHEFAMEIKNIKVHKILNLISSENKKKMQIRLISEIASGNIRMKDYIRIFSENYDYNSIMDSVKGFVKKVEYELPELNGKDRPISFAKLEIHNLKKYKNPYKKSNFIGMEVVFKKPDSDEMDRYPITDEDIDYAVQYLKYKDEYICHSTVNYVLNKLAKGEIQKEPILDYDTDEQNKLGESIDESDKYEKQDEIDRFYANCKKLHEIEAKLVEVLKAKNMPMAQVLNKKKKSLEKEVREYLNR